MLAPFHGVRYAEDMVSGLAEVTSPPYDVIALDKEDQLMAADPHNVVRLILPRHSAGQPGGKYRDAACALRQWREEGILVADPVPALYVYEQVAVGEGATVAPKEALIQRGLIGALLLVPLDAGIVLPHEDVAPGPVRDRRQLMEATQANLEPIFLLYDGSAPAGAATPGGEATPGAATAIVEQTAAAREPLVEAHTTDGLRHRLWAITAAAELAAVAADLRPRQALIADGHHRYAAYLNLQDRRHQAGDGPGPWDLGLALMVDSAAYPPWIGAIHRVIPGLAPQQAAELARTAFCVRALAGGPAGLPGALDALALAGEGGPSFLAAGGEHTYLLTDPDPAQLAAAMPPERSARWRGLAASILQELLIERVWGIKDNERSVRVVHHDAAAALSAADHAPGGTAVICSPLSAADVYAVAAQGEKVPRKSTSFRPKPRTGLVMRTFAQG
jgi:uncharacterized protein (DUF1015 family)